MTSRRSVLTKMILIAAALAFAGVAQAADRTAELQERFKQRFAQVRSLKDAGKIGETSTGLLGEVKAGDAAAAKVIADENADRQELYGLIAKKEGTTPDVVARTNATRNFQRAKKGDWLKADDGQWRQKP
jgi:uncharacterized protein YdbL (DUF1318 family)